MPSHIETIDSEVLQANVPFAVILPEGSGPFPVLYDLHGLLSDEGPYTPKPTSRTFFEKLAFRKFQHVADETGTILVKVNGGRGWYLDSPRIENSQYASHLIDEVIPYVESKFSVIGNAAARGVSGHSMGGMGVMNFLCRWPELFSVGAMHCASLRFMQPDDHRGSYIEDLMSDDELRAAFPETFLEALIRPELKLRVSVGLHDKPRILEENRRLHAFLLGKNQPHEYSETRGGHEYAPYGWDGMVWAAKQVR